MRTLMAARSVNFENYVAHTDEDPLPYIAMVCQRLETYLRETSPESASLPDITAA